jgi:hypothetical protein
MNCHALGLIGCGDLPLAVTLQGLKQIGLLKNIYVIVVVILIGRFYARNYIPHSKLTN